MMKNRVSIDIRPWLVKKQEEIEAVCKSQIISNVESGSIISETNRRKVKAWDELLRMVDYGKC